MRLLRAIARANAPRPPEESVRFRVACGAAVAVSLLAASAGGELPWAAGLAATALVVTGMSFSWATRAAPPGWVKLVVAAGALGAIGWFGVRIDSGPISDITAVESALTVLFVAVLVLHSFHVPAGTDLLFALVAARALAPDSKLAMEDWVAHDVVLPGVAGVEVHDLYQVMDLVLDAEADLQSRVFGAVADMLNLEVDLLFFDTTNVYFCRDEEDRTPTGGKGFRARGHSKEKRDDLPLVSIGLAVTRTGIPVRCWCWPGNTSDASVIPEVKRDLIGWKLGRVITVIDRGFTSAENLRTLQQTGGHYIAGERMRSGQADIEQALARAGRFKSVRDNIEIKEIVIGDGEARKRFVLIRNPFEAERDRRRREEVLAELRRELRELPPDGRGYAAAVERIRGERRYGPYLGKNRQGEPCVDAVKVHAAERLDGKYLVSTSDDTLSAEDVALGYRQLLEVERCFRTLKTTLDLRPHRYPHLLRVAKGRGTWTCSDRR